MWSTDYPHTGSDWPNHRVTIERLFRGLPKADVKKMLHGNCKALYRPGPRPGHASREPCPSRGSASSSSRPASPDRTRRSSWPTPAPTSSRSSTRTAATRCDAGRRAASTSRRTRTASSSASSTPRSGASRSTGRRRRDARGCSSSPPAPTWSSRASGSTLDGRSPRAVRATSLVSISWFGRIGTVGRPAGDGVHAAGVGRARRRSRGTIDRPPLAARRTARRMARRAATPRSARSPPSTGARRTGRGQHVDLSMLEVVHLSMAPFTTVVASFRGAGAGAAHHELPSIEPAADGWVGFCTITNQQWRDFLVLIERGDLVDDAELAYYFTRDQRRDEVYGDDPRVDAPPHGRGDHRARDAAAHPGRADRQRRDGARLRPLPRARRLRPAPGQPARAAAAAVPARPRHAAPARRAPPRLGEHTDRHGWDGPRAPPRRRRRRACRSPASACSTSRCSGPARSSATSSRRWAPTSSRSSRCSGPTASASRARSSRRPIAGGSGAAMFHGINAGKRGVTLDLSDPRGLELARDLAARADVLVENFSPRVLDNLGLRYEELARANPGLVMVRMPAFGLDGPWRDRVGFAQTMEQISGLAWVTGFADGPPVIPRGPCDPLAGMHAVLALLVALEHRRQHRRGPARRVDDGRGGAQRHRRSGARVAGVRPPARPRRQSRAGGVPAEPLCLPRRGAVDRARGRDRCAVARAGRRCSGARRGRPTPRSRPSRGRRAARGSHRRGARARGARRATATRSSTRLLARGIPAAPVVPSERRSRRIRRCARAASSSRSRIR